MSSFAIGGIVFGFVFGGAVLGVLLRSFLPTTHLSAETKDAVRLGMGLVGTMAALVLGLLVASAKSSYDAQTIALTELSAKTVLLDRVLRGYGPEAKEARESLRGGIVRIMEKVWPKEQTTSAQLLPTVSASEDLYGMVQALSPKDDRQRVLQSQALSMMMGMGQTRWLMYEQVATSVSRPLMIMMVFWLTIIFISWGLFAPSNATVLASFFVAALSVSGAIFLILELYAPYSGWLRTSNEPLRLALAVLGQ